MVEERWSKGREVKESTLVLEYNCNFEQQGNNDIDL